MERCFDLREEDIKYKLYSPSLEDKPFFDWPIKELDLSDKSKNKSKTDRPIIVRPKVNISEKVLIDRITNFTINHLLSYYDKGFDVSDQKIREYRAGGDYHEHFHKGFELTKEIVTKIIHITFEDSRERERLRKEKELKEAKPEVVVLKASELLHSE